MINTSFVMAIYDKKNGANIPCILKKIDEYLHLDCTRVLNFEHVKLKDNLIIFRNTKPLDDLQDKYLEIAKGKIAKDTEATFLLGKLDDILKFIKKSTEIIKSKKGIFIIDKDNYFII